MIKLIAIDMDGTLLDGNKQLPERNIRAIQRVLDKGIKVVLCTGRPQSGVLPYFKQLPLNGCEEYAILDNGCTIYQTKDWSLLAHSALSPDAIETIVANAKEYDGIAVTFFDQTHYFIVGTEIPDLVSYDAGLVFNTVTPIDLKRLKSNPSPILQGMFIGEATELDQFQAAKDAVLSQAFSMVRSQPCLYEVMPKGTTKASALKQLAKHLGLSANDIMAIGDAANDIEMLEFAGTSVAMGNASNDVKALADYITADHNQAGVASALEKLILT